MPLPPILIHEQPGLKICKNKGNGFVICTLHYSANPSKRDPRWITEAKGGLSPAKWAREYEIEYFATMGEKVFPEFTNHRDLFVIKPPYPEVPVTIPCWGGFDYGTRNPSSFHVYTIIGDIIYSIWELFDPCKNLPDFASRMLACPYWGQIKYISTDPKLWAKDQQTREGSLTSIQQLFWDNGVRKMIRGIQDDQAFIARMHQLLKDPENPGFQVWDHCVNQIRELSTAMYVSMSEKQLLSKSYNEAIEDKDNHSLDDLKYFLNSQPVYKPRSFTMPDLSKMWRK
jgi:hypothetical protein